MRPGAWRVAATKGALKGTRSGELPAIKVGGRGQWRVETTVLEEYIQRMYSQTREFVQSQGEDRPSP